MALPARSSLRWKLAALAAAPLLILLAVITLDPLGERGRDLPPQFLPLATNAERIADAVRALQDEGAESEAFLHARGRARGAELRAARRESDRCLSELEDGLESLDPKGTSESFRHALDEARVCLDEAVRARDAITSLSVTATAATSYYQAATDGILGLFRELPWHGVVPDADARLLAFATLLRIRAGAVEKAKLLARALERGRYDDGEFERLIWLSARDESDRRLFESLASEELRERWDRARGDARSVSADELLAEALKARHLAAAGPDAARWTVHQSARIELLDELSRSGAQELARVSQELAARKKARLPKSIALLLCCLGISAVLFLGIQREIFPRLDQALRGIRALRGGDTSSQYVHRNGDELGTLVLQLAALQGELAERWEREADFVGQERHHLSAVADLAASARALALDNRDLVEDATGSLAAMIEKTRAMAESLASIEDTAFQTNLLALNAAVEAERLGDPARGFSAIASQFRDHAESCTEASRHIEATLMGLVDDSGRGSEALGRSHASLGDLADAVETMAEALQPHGDDDGGAKENFANELQRLLAVSGGIPDGSPE